MGFLDRMVADSRSIGLYHTSGLSTPQQVFMAHKRAVGTFMCVALTNRIVMIEHIFCFKTRKLIRMAPIL